jgi:hypothetical protein
MTHHRVPLAATLTWTAVLLLVSAAAVFAQDVATTFEELRLKIGRGATVYVTENDGQEYTATVVSVSATAFTVSVGGKERSLEQSAIRRIRQRLPDSLWGGVLIGGGIGVALGALSVGLADDCSGGCAASPVISGAMFAAIGAGIDALIEGKKVIYEPGAAGRSAWNLSPLIGRGAAGARLTVVF